VAQSLGVGLGTISGVVTRAQGAGLDWPQVQPLSDEVLEGRLYGRPELAGQRQRPAPDYTWIHAERRGLPEKASLKQGPFAPGALPPFIARMTPPTPRPGGERAAEVAPLFPLDDA
jgi:hypothetical protein